MSRSVDKAPGTPRPRGTPRLFERLDHRPSDAARASWPFVQRKTGRSPVDTCVPPKVELSQGLAGADFEAYGMARLMATTFQHGTTTVITIVAGCQLPPDADEGPDPLDLVEACQPDVVLLDLHPGGEAAAIELADKVARRSPGSALIVVSRSNHAVRSSALRRIGVRACFTNDSSASDLIDGIYQASRDRLPSAAKSVSQARRGPSRPSRVPESRRGEGRLTTREAQVLQSIAAGNSTPRTGEVLGISVRSVDRHLAQIFGKLGVENRTQAVLIAIREEIIALQPTQSLR